MTREEFLKTFQKFVRDYRTAPASLERIKNVCLVIIIGPSGVGKSSIIDRLGVHFVVPDTTRAIRPREKDAVDMHFLTDYRQVIADIKAGRFLQVAVGATGDFYATRASSYPSSGLAVMPVMADVVPIFRRLGFKKTINAFITPPSYEEWLRRLKVHPVTEQQLAKRLSEAKRSFDFALNDPEVHFILNEDLEKAVVQIKQLIKGQADINREDLARQAAKAIRASIN